VTQLKSFATDYNGTEDRIRLRCAFVDGDYSTLWLTQRLATQLIRHLEASLLGRKDELVTDPSAIQAEPAAFPEAACGRRQWLVEAIDIAPLTGPTKPFQITFRSTTSTAIVTLEVSAVRQWLNCLIQLYAAAQWPTPPLQQPMATDKLIKEPPEASPARQRTH